MATRVLAATAGPSAFENDGAMLGGELTPTSAMSSRSHLVFELAVYYSQTASINCSSTQPEPEKCVDQQSGTAQRRQQERRTQCHLTADFVIQG